MRMVIGGDFSDDGLGRDGRRHRRGAPDGVDGTRLCTGIASPKEYTQDSNKGMSGPDFTVHIASVCPSERQNFRVSLIDYLSMQFPAVDVGDHLTTANNAIALAQADIVNAFIKHKAAAK